jgi:hypothetical protein
MGRHILGDDGTHAHDRTVTDMKPLPNDRTSTNVGFVFDYTPTTDGGERRHDNKRTNPGVMTHGGVIVQQDVLC